MGSANPPSALVLGSPRYAMSILLAAKAQNIRIPDDLSLVAYGDVSWGSLLDVKLTTITLPETEIASACVAIIRQWMSAETPVTPEAFYAATQSHILRRNWFRAVQPPLSGHGVKRKTGCKPVTSGMKLPNIKCFEETI